MINVWLNPDSTTGIDASCRLFDLWIQETARESEIIRAYLLKKSVDILNEKAFELLVHQCQAALIRLLDKVFSYKHQVPSSAFKAMYDAVLKHLEGLLHHIETHYPRYFNKAEKVPDHILQATRAHIKKELKYLEKTVFPSIDSRLRKIVGHHLQKFTQHNSGEIISYKKIAYIKDLVSELRNIPLEAESASRQLMELLIFMNFNTSDLLNYYVANLQVITAECSTTVLKREALLSALKELNQLQEKPGVAFKPQMKNIKVQISAWISEELHYLEQQQACFNAATVLSPNVIEKEEDEKLQTTLSVQQLAIFIRAARDIGILTNKNQTALLKTFAKVFRTPQAETISAESLRVKYYAVEPGAKESIKDLLLEMFKKVQSY